MARYIDADALIESIQETLCSKCDKYDGIKCKSCGIDDTLDFLDTAPTADVAPKSEVEETVKKLMDATDKVICEAKAEVAREIFEEIEGMLDNYHSACLPVGAIEAYTYYEGGLGEAIAELKKKYTEERE